jgi:hypothetical protein
LGPGERKRPREEIGDLEGTMGSINNLMTADHRRLEALLKRVDADPEHTDTTAFTEFRAGLLRHIGMEERILLPAVRSRKADEPLAHEEQIRKDHAALAALMVPPPLPQVLAAIRGILKIHDAREEGAEGIYAEIDDRLSAEENLIIQRLREAPPVPVSPFVGNPDVLEATKRVLARSGYEFDPFGVR